jgi:hypothetical protein
MGTQLRLGRLQGTSQRITVWAMRAGVMHSRTVPCLGLALLTTLALIAPAQRAQAERTSRVQIDGTIGTRFGGRMEVDLEDDDGDHADTGTLTTDSTMAWGILAAYQIQSNGNVFLSYSRQETTFRFRSESYSDDEWNIDETSAEGSIEYFQFGGNLQLPTRYVIPYFGVSAGVTRVASEGEGGDWARFNLTLDGGLRFDFVPILDVRVFSRVPFTFPASDVYCFSGRGCAVVSHAGPFVQGEVHAGLGLKF